jgi:hypothetical protein
VSVRLAGCFLVLPACGLAWAQVGGELGAEAAAKGEHSIDLAAIASASDRALDALSGAGVWPRASLVRVLAGVRILVREKRTWTNRATGHEVAGLAYLDLRTVEIGSDLAALTHEYAELSYAALEKHPAECFHCTEWPGRAKLQAAIDSTRDP